MRDGGARRFEAAWAEARDAFEALLRAHGIVGGTLLVTHGADVRGRAHYGMADREAGRPVEADTIFHWASITKTLTGLAVMQLRDRGRLGLDDALVDHLPELRAVHNPFGPMEAVTIRHVMSHAAGFRQATWPWGGDRDWHPHEPAAWAQLAAMLPYTEIHFAPGSRFRYSNLAVVFLGRIIEQITGDPYAAYAEKNILRPLGMHRSYFDHTPYHLLPHRANNYDLVDGVPQPNGLDFHTGVTVSNGGLNAPAADLARYLAFLAGRHAPEVLARASLEAMWVPQHPAGADGPYRQFIGLSFFGFEGKGLRVVGHTGSQKGFRAFLYLDPATGAGAAAAVNATGRGGPPDAMALLHALRRRLFDTVFP
ncbi:MAG: serine hydrolase domain-containing protein, partial [Rhodothermales bacterium]|nr:serine hydrolase domain-containing protein [Rhodothermales bacterium]